MDLVFSPKGKKSWSRQDNSFKRSFESQPLPLREVKGPLSEPETRWVLPGVSRGRWGLAGPPPVQPPLLGAGTGVCHGHVRNSRRTGGSDALRTQHRRVPGRLLPHGGGTPRDAGLPPPSPHLCIVDFPDPSRSDLTLRGKNSETRRGGWQKPTPALPSAGHPGR